MRAASRLLALSWFCLSIIYFASSCRKPNPRRSGHAPAVVIRNLDADFLEGIPEQEPNHTFAQAHILKPGSSWRILGQLGDANAGKEDVDTFLVTVPSRGSQLPGNLSRDSGVDFRISRLSLSVQAGAASSLMVDMLDEAQQTIASLFSARGVETVVPNIAVIPNGRYFIRVKATGKTGSKTGPSEASDAASSGLNYTLAIDIGEFGPGDEREPNNQVIQAELVQPFAGSIELAGYLSQNRDEDWYRIPLPPVPSALSLEVGSVKGVAIGLRIVDEGGTKLTGTVGQTGLNVLLPNVRLPSPALDAGVSQGAVFLVVRAESGRNPTDRYVLRLNLGPHAADIEAEPNDIPSQGTLITEPTIRGYLPRGDVDFFLVKVHPNQPIEVRVDPPPRPRLIMEVSRLSDGQSIGRQEARKPHDPISTTITPTTEDTFLIRLAPRKGEGHPNQPYALSIRPLSPSNLGFPPKPPL